jgi:hypothetical protein
MFAVKTSLVSKCWVYGITASMFRMNQTRDPIYFSRIFPAEFYSLLWHQRWDRQYGSVHDTFDRFRYGEGCRFCGHMVGFCRCNENCIGCGEQFCSCKYRLDGCLRPDCPCHLINPDLAHYTGVIDVYDLMLHSADCEDGHWVDLHPDIVLRMQEGL